MTTDVAGRLRTADHSGGDQPTERCRHRWVEATITSIHGDAKRVERRELDRAIGRLDACDDLTDGQRKVVEAMADAIVGRLLAVPVGQLRRAPDWSALAAALRLFDAELTGNGPKRADSSVPGASR